MTLRSDHVAGGAFIAFGVLIFALSGDLPAGRLAMPGSGFMPKLVAALMMIFGLALVLRARESESFASIPWDDGVHALSVVGVTLAATILYTRLGFILTMLLMMLALLVFVERRKPLHAGLYAAGAVLGTYGIFKFALKAPLPLGPFGF